MVYRKITGLILAGCMLTQQCFGLTDARTAITPPSVFISHQDTLNLPSTLGTFQRLGNSADPVLFHILTTHGDYETQKKIESILEYLHQKKRIDGVLVEGSANSLDLSRLEWIRGQRDLNLKISRRLAEKSIIKGPELFLQRHPNISGWGIEDHQSYLQNRKDFSGLLKFRRERKGLLKELDEMVREALIRSCGKAFRKFALQLIHFQDSDVPDTAFLREWKKQARTFLDLDFDSAASQRDWPMLVRYFKIQKLESEIGRQAGLGASEKDRPFSFKGTLETLESQALLHARKLNAFPKFKARVGMEIVSREVDSGKLMQEVNQLGFCLLKLYAETKDEALLAGVLTDRKYLRELLRLQMPAEDFQENLSRMDVGAMDSTLKVIEKLSQRKFSKSETELFRQILSCSVRFYQNALKRDVMMSRKTLRLIRSQKLLSPVLITGGFHAQGMEDRLIQKGYQVIQITPFISSEPDETDLARYGKNFETKIPIAPERHAALWEQWVSDPKWETYAPDSRQRLLKTLRPILAEAGRGRDLPRLEARLFSSSEKLLHASRGISPRRSEVRVDFETESNLKKQLLRLTAHPFMKSFIKRYGIFLISALGVVFYLFMDNFLYFIFLPEGGNRAPLWMMRWITGGTFLALATALQMLVNQLRSARLSIQASDEVYLHLVKALPQYIFRKDLEGRFTFGNQVFLDSLGLKSMEELVGKTDSDFYPADMVDQYRVDDQKVFKGGKLDKVETHKIREDNILFVRVTKIPIHDQAGKIVGLQGIFEDVTESQRAQRELEANRDFFRNLAEQVPGSMYVFRMAPDGSFSMPYATPEFMTDYFGVSLEQAAKDATSIFQAVHVDDRQILKKSIQASAESLLLWNREFRVVQSGKVRWLRAHSRPEKLPDGSVVWYGFVEDVTQQKAALDSLLDATERLKLAQEAAQMGVWDWDIQTSEITWSPHMYRLFGVESNIPATLDLWKSRLHPEDREKALQILQDALANKKRFDAEYRILLSNGKYRWIHALADSMEGADGKPVRMVGMCVDITSQKIAAGHRAESESRRRISLLIRKIVHDLNNSLAVISMQGSISLEEVTDMLSALPTQREVPVPEDRGLADFIHRQSESWEAAVKAAGLMALRLKLLMAYAGIEFNSSAEVDVLKEIRSICAAAQEKYKVSVNLEAKQTKAVVKMNPAGVIAIFHNLIVNAMQASELIPNKQIQVMVDTATLTAVPEPMDSRTSDYRIVSSAFQAGDFIKVEIRDSGKGILPENFPHLFTDFYSTDQHRAGIGLVTVKNAVEAVGGVLDFQSHAGQGTTVVVYLPSAAQAGKNGNGHSELPRGNQEWIWVLEDEDAVARPLVEMLRRLNYRVVHFSNPSDMLASGDQSTSVPDFLLSDMKIVNDDWGGFNGFKEMRLRNSNLPCLFMSGEPVKEILDEALRYENTAFLQKPASAEDIARKIHAMLKQKRQPGGSQDGLSGRSEVRRELDVREAFSPRLLGVRGQILPWRFRGTAAYQKHLTRIERGRHGPSYEWQRADAMIRRQQESVQLKVRVPDSSKPDAARQILETAVWIGERNSAFRISLLMSSEEAARILKRQLQEFLADRFWDEPSMAQALMRRIQIQEAERTDVFAMSGSVRTLMMDWPQRLNAEPPSTIEPSEIQVFGNFITDGTVLAFDAQSEIYAATLLQAVTLLLRGEAESGLQKLARSFVYVQSHRSTLARFASLAAEIRATSVSA